MTALVLEIIWRSAEVAGFVAIGAAPLAISLTNFVTRPRG